MSLTFLCWLCSDGGSCVCHVTRPCTRLFSSSEHQQQQNFIIIDLYASMTIYVLNFNLKLLTVLGLRALLSKFKLYLSLQEAVKVFSVNQLKGFMPQQTSVSWLFDCLSSEVLGLDL